jgi:hypothetical protein
MNWLDQRGIWELLEEYESEPCCLDLSCGPIGFFELRHKMSMYLDEE